MSMYTCACACDVCAELVFYWNDNNRFKPMTTVTTLATRGAALYIGGRRSVIRRARRGQGFRFNVTMLN